MLSRFCSDYCFGENICRIFLLSNLQGIFKKSISFLNEIILQVLIQIISNFAAQIETRKNFTDNYFSFLINGISLPEKKTK